MAEGIVGASCMTTGAVGPAAGMTLRFWGPGTWRVYKAYISRSKSSSLNRT
jgi:hypothetical protein